jgi:hypothetical protein
MEITAISIMSLATAKGMPVDHCSPYFLPGEVFDRQTALPND